MSTIQVFGYGSLINETSMRASSPRAVDIMPAYITGFRRSFAKWNGLEHLSETARQGRIPFCALDVQPHESHRVNGVVFKVDDREFEKLIEREYGYQMLETAAYHYDSDDNVGTTYVFSAENPTSTYDFGNASQERYLQICLAGAQNLGDSFYQEFIETTYIADSRLHEAIRLEA
jgi:cation transport regulator ChaC